MENQQLFEEIQTFDKCPNCEGNNFLLPQRECLDCGYNLEHKKITEKTSEKLEEELINPREIKKLKIEYNGLKSYEIIIDNKNISFIKFSIKHDDKIYRFIVKINYKIEHIKEKKLTNYYEGKEEDRYTIIENYVIKNLQIEHIAEKAKVGYKESKKSPNYFKYLGLNYHKTIGFIKEILKQIHNIDEIL